MSNHIIVNQRNSCVFQPRNPQTGLPTTFLERKLFDFSSLGGSTNVTEIESKDKINTLKNNKLVCKQCFKKLPGESEHVLSLHKEDESFVEDSLNNQNNFSLSKLNESDEEKPYYQPDKEKFYESLNSEELKKLIDDDEKFFSHLEFLKNENKKTLKKLERLYNISLEVAKVKKVKKNGCGISYGSNKKEQEKTFAASNKSCSSSDDEGEILEENDQNSITYEHSDFRSGALSYDVISNMWDNFSVEEYAPYVKTSPRKNKSWSPSITIPEPFQMTIRDEKKGKKKSKKIQKIEDELLLKQLREEAELHKKIVPTPIPASTFLPLYEEINRQQERNRRYIRNIKKHMLISTQRPFSFIKREEAKKDLKRSYSAETINTQKNNQFHAKPYPEKLFDLSLADKMAEEDEYRKIKIKLRAQELLASSSLPPSMKRRDKVHYKMTKKNENSKNDRKSFKPVVHHEIPDFESLHKKIINELEEKKRFNLSTVCNPFELKTMKIPERRLIFKKNSSKDSSKDNSQLNRSCNTKAKSPTHSHMKSEQSPTYSLNETARLRQERLKSTIEKSKIDSLRKSIEETKKRKEQENLRKSLVTKVASQDPSRNREVENEEKIKRFREADYARRCEYDKYLHDINTKLNSRPLLFERESQTNAKLKASRRYEEVLRDAGVCENDLEKIMRRQVNSQTSEFFEESMNKKSNESSDFENNKKNASHNISSDDDISSLEDKVFKDSIAEDHNANLSNGSDGEGGTFTSENDGLNSKSSDDGSYKQS
ncbi:protein FAM161A [Hydra vulgaris]|uniref:protein FAM161A n=1 Tax=Hydra vulgaris TaxID=6087 RepID=UPI001F5E417A|nr:protein FAM161A [Hydra vulgaris]